MLWNKNCYGKWSLGRCGWIWWSDYPGRIRDKMPANPDEGRTRENSPEDQYFLLLEYFLLLCPHTEEGVRQLSGLSLIRALIPFMRFLCPHNWIASQSLHLQIPSHWRSGINVWMRGRSTNIWSIVEGKLTSRVTSLFGHNRHTWVTLW